MTDRFVGWWLRLVAPVRGRYVNAWTAQPSTLRWLWAVVLVVPLLAGAQPVEPTVAPPAPVLAPVPRVAMPTNVTTSPGAGGLLQTIMALMLVLGLLIGLAWLLKRYGPRPGGGAANLRVVGALNIGGRERIMVVEVGDQWIIVGAAPGRVNALHTMPRQEGELSAAAALGGTPATSFADWLKNTIDKRNAP